MSAFSTVETAISDFEAKLHTDASHLLDEFKSLIGKLTGQAEADAADVAKQAETAAAPVVATAEADAAALAQEAVAGAEEAVGGGVKPATTAPTTPAV